MNFGLRRTARHIAGVNLGFSSLLVATTLGLGTLFETVGWLSPALRILGSTYLVYLAYRIATAGRTRRGEAGRPMTFIEAVAFQYVNPKAWIMAITVAGSFLPAGQPLGPSVALITVVFAVVNLPCIFTWAVAGSAIGRLLVDDRKRRILSVLLAALLVGTVYLINS